MKLSMPEDKHELRENASARLVGLSSMLSWRCACLFDHPILPDFAPRYAGCASVVAEVCSFQPVAKVICIERAYTVSVQPISSSARLSFWFSRCPKKWDTIHVISSALAKS